jgi:hypothetical protein
MLGPVDAHHGGPLFAVRLDGRWLELPPSIGSSLRDLRAYVESVAFAQNRVVAEFLVHSPATEAGAAGSQDLMASHVRVDVDSVSVAELSQDLIAAARQRVEGLQTTVRTLSERMLINEWPSIEGAWHAWEGELRAPKWVGGFLCQLCGDRLKELSLDGQTLGEHLIEFDGVWTDLKVAAARRDTMAVSDVLDQRLSPWLTHFSGYLTLLGAA